MEMGQLGHNFPNQHIFNEKRLGEAGGVEGMCFEVDQDGGDCGEIGVYGVAE